MAETWYRLQRWAIAEITPVEVERHTESSVWIKGRRNARTTAWDSYFRTWEAARDCLLKRAELDLAASRRQLEQAQGFLGNVKGLKPPTVEAPQS